MASAADRSRTDGAVSAARSRRFAGSVFLCGEQVAPVEDERNRFQLMVGSGIARVGIAQQGLCQPECGELRSSPQAPRRPVAPTGEPINATN